MLKTSCDFLERLQFSLLSLSLPSSSSSLALFLSFSSVEQEEDHYICSAREADEMVQEINYYDYDDNIIYV